MFSRDAASSTTASNDMAATAGAVAQCLECYGKGEVRVDCPRCDGCGKETCHECGGNDTLPTGARSTPWLSCMRCDGTGREKCGACHGCGYKWGPCVSCEGKGELSAEALAALQERKHTSQQLREAENWEYYEEEARRWDQEIGQWFEQDLNRRIERRRLQRQEQRQRRWKMWKRRTATATCLTVLALLGFRYGPSGVLRAQSEARRYLRPTRVKPAAVFTPTQRRLTRDELKRHSRRQLDLLRHEILARRGLKITRRDLAQSFARKPWYRPDSTNPRVVWDRLSPTEQYNLWLLTELLAHSGLSTHAQQKRTMRRDIIE